jgi:hypothetical protein
MDKTPHLHDHQTYRASAQDRPVPTDRGFLFIRSASATPFILRALNPQDGSNSSSLTSTNVSVVISPQLHTRKVAGSIPAATTPKSLQIRGLTIELGR